LSEKIVCFGAPVLQFFPRLRAIVPREFPWVLVFAPSRSSWVLSRRAVSRRTSVIKCSVFDHRIRFRLKFRRGRLFEQREIRVVRLFHFLILFLLDDRKGNFKLFKSRKMLEIRKKFRW
jgi:hypothetical protein